MIEVARNFLFRSRIVPGLIAFGAFVAFAGLIAGCGALTTTSAGTPVPVVASQPAAPVVHLATRILNGNWPQYSPTNFTVTKGDTVVLTITSFDPGVSVLPAAFTKVQGTVGGVELLNGQPVTEITASQGAHTLTIPALGVNIVVPAVPAGQKSVTVQATFTVTKSGNFVWQCMAPCGTGATGWEGPMADKGYMSGAFNVVN
ncbi:MAG: cupredoxin domain-containing protein [Sulfobacillus sp.]